MQAGGFIVQVMPFAEEEVLSKAGRKRIKNIRVCDSNASGAVAIHRKSLLEPRSGRLGRRDHMIHCLHSLTATAPKSVIEKALISVGKKRDSAR